MHMDISQTDFLCETGPESNSWTNPAQNATPERTWALPSVVPLFGEQKVGGCRSKGARSYLAPNRTLTHATSDISRSQRASTQHLKSSHHLLQSQLHEKYVKQVSCQYSNSLWDLTDPVGYTSGPREIVDSIAPSPHAPTFQFFSFIDITNDLPG